MSFYVNDKLVRTDSTIPSWILGDPDSAWTPTVGIHTIKAIGHRGNEGRGTKMLESSVSVKVIDTRRRLLWPQSRCQQQVQLLLPLRLPCP
jgi:hypothetical protein